MASCQKRKIVKGNLCNFGEGVLVNSKLKTRFATDLLMEELKRFNTVLKAKGRRPGKDSGTVGGHVCHLFNLKELAGPGRSWKKLPRNPER